MDTAESLNPIFTAHLYTRLEDKLIELLRSLDAEEWEAQTIAPAWKVKDVAAHLLDTQLRKLSLARDGYYSNNSKSESHDDLVSFINKLNAEGVAIYRRLSPQVLITLMEIASRESAEYHESLDQMAMATFGVSWAGQDRSQNWFDTAREFTERWHHQQQIRLAVNMPGIMTREFYYPVLDTFMRALPYHYRTLSRVGGSMIQFTVSGECGGDWYLCSSSANWKLAASLYDDKISRVIIPQEIAWRIFTKGIDLESARAETKIEGDVEAGSHILGMITIVG